MPRHGAWGPIPATSDGRSTSVVTRAILRFTRPVCYQDFPDAALPPELQRQHPLGIMRRQRYPNSRRAELSHRIL